MDYVVIGGDARMAQLAGCLCRAGRSARHILAGGEDARDIASAAEMIRGAENLAVNCPPRPRGTGLTLRELLAMARPDARVFLCGPGSTEIDDARIVDLWRDEALLRENAYLTAEGAVAAAMGRGGACIRGMKCAVIGWGRVGSAAAELLVAMGARAVVVSGSQAHRNRAVERGVEAVPPEALGEALTGARLVLSTAPALVLDGAALEYADPAAMIIDLASPPYGVDLQAAWAQGLRAWREPGLPGRYCPESAGLALMRAMERSGVSA